MSSTSTIAFIKDIRSGDAKAVRARLKKGKERPNQTFIDPAAAGRSYTLLHKAVEVASAAIVGELLAAGAEVDARDGAGASPLAWAAGAAPNAAPAGQEGARTAIATALIAAGADIHARDASGLTPLHAAAAAGNAEVAGVLLAAGADPAARCSLGQTPLHAAAAAGHTADSNSVANVLVQAGADAAALDAGNRTPLVLLLQRGHWAQALEFAARHAEAYRPSGAAAACDAQTGLCALSLVIDAAPPDEQPVGTTAATAAPAAAPAAAAATSSVAAPHKGGSKRSGSSGPPRETIAALVDALLAAGASPDTRDGDGDTPLMRAVRGARCAGTGLALRLLQASTDVNATNVQRGSVEDALSLALELLPQASSGSSSSSTNANTSTSSSNNGDDSRHAAARALVAELLRRGAKLREPHGSALFRAAWSAGEDELCSLVVAAMPDDAATPLTYEACVQQRPELGRTAAALLMKETRARCGCSGGDASVLASASWRGAQDDAGNTHLALAAALPGDATGPVCAALASVAGIPADAANKKGDTALFLAARAGNLAVCRALIAAGADVLHRNAKSRTPATQLHLAEHVREVLAEAEAQARAARAERVRALFDAKLAATQTANGCALRAV